MASPSLPLTDTKIKNAKPKEKDYKLSDTRGLYLLVTKSGGKHWKLKYYFETKEQKLSLGAYPEISLLKARELREIYKSQVANGVNPVKELKRKKEANKALAAKNLNTFEKLARERLLKVEDGISETHHKRSLKGLENDCFPFIGHLPMDEVKASHIIEILQIMTKRGVRDSAKKVYYSISKTFVWAVANGHAERNPASDIQVSEIIGKAKVKNYVTIVDNEGIKNLLTSIEEYPGCQRRS